MNVNQNALRDIVNAEVEGQVGDRSQNSVATVIEDPFMDAIQLAKDC